MESDEEQIVNVSINEVNSPLIINNNFIHKNLITFHDLFEKPEKVIEKILIKIYNHNINSDQTENEQLNIIDFKKRVKILCTKYENYEIILLLLSKIKSLIKRYKEKIFELPDVIRLRENLTKKLFLKKHTQKNLISLHNNEFKLQTKIQRCKSTPKKQKNEKTPNYFTTMEKVFCELKNIKNSLEKSSIFIETIFEIPLSEFDSFSIYDCEKEIYSKLLIHDEFIWNEIINNRKTRLNYLIKEIVENENSPNTMTEKLNYFSSIDNCKKIYDNELKIAEIGSSKDERFPEIAIPFEEIKTDNEKKNDFNLIISNIEEKNKENEKTFIQEVKSIEKIEILNNEEHTIVHNGKKKIEKNSLTKIYENKYSMPVSFIDQKNELEKTYLNFQALKNKFKKESKKIKKRKEKFQQEFNEQENNNKVNKNEKKDIPSDIDDLVKYIANDDKKENIQSTKKKKKKNKKSKKKKDEIEEDEEDKLLNEDDEINRIKEDLIKNSINRYKIHKIKFKPREEWLKEISNNPFV